MINTPEIWSRKLQERFYAESILGAMCPRVVPVKPNLWQRIRTLVWSLRMWLAEKIAGREWHYDTDRW